MSYSYRIAVREGGLRLCGLDHAPFILHRHRPVLDCGGLTYLARQGARFIGQGSTLLTASMFAFAVAGLIVPHCGPCHTQCFRHRHTPNPKIANFGTHLLLLVSLLFLCWFNRAPLVLMSATRGGIVQFQSICGQTATLRRPLPLPSLQRACWPVVSGPSTPNEA